MLYWLTVMVLQLMDNFTKTLALSSSILSSCGKQSCDNKRIGGEKRHEKRQILIGQILYILVWFICLMAYQPLMDYLMPELDKFLSV